MGTFPLVLKPTSHTGLIYAIALKGAFDCGPILQEWEEQSYGDKQLLQGILSGPVTDPECNDSPKCHGLKSRFSD